MNSKEYRLMRDCEDAHWWYASLRRLLEVSLRRILPPGAPGKILDAGCGTGGNLAFLQEEFPQTRMSGFDLCSEAVDLTQCRNLKASLTRASVNAIPFASGSFDVVICMDVLYFQGVDEGAALTEIGRVLKPGGFLILNLPAFEGLRGVHDLAVSTRRRYLLEDIDGLLTLFDFKPERIFYWNSFLFPLIWLKRKWGTGKGSGKVSSDLAVSFSAALNFFLKQLLRFEIFLANSARFPFGASVFAVAHKAS